MLHHYTLRMKNATSRQSWIHTTDRSSTGFPSWSCLSVPIKVFKATSADEWDPSSGTRFYLLLQGMFKNKQLNTVTHFATRDMRKKKKEVGKCQFLFAHLINLLFVLPWSFTELLTHYFINNPEVRRAARSSPSHSLFQRLCTIRSVKLPSYLFSKRSSVSEFSLKSG